MKTSGRTIRAGLIGASIQSSRTPRMHMCEGAAQGLDYQYDLLDLDLIPGGSSGLRALIDQAEADGYAGLNVTHPCKQQVIELLTDLTADSDAIGAVNTVIFDGGRRTGDNTDWWGYAEAFRRGLTNPQLDEVILVGAGGGGAAVAYALLKMGVGRLQVFDTERSHAEGLVERFSKHFGSDRIALTENLEAAIQQSSGVVHTTPTGMKKYPGTAFETDWLRSRQWVSEIVYVPLQTELIKAASARGCRVLDGSGMAVFQAVRAFELFTGLEADVPRMYEHFNQFEGVR